MKEEEIAQCIISPSITALWLYRGRDQLHLCAAEKKKGKKESEIKKDRDAKDRKRKPEL